MDLNGVPCIIRDTAGVRAESLAADEIEMEGIKRAKCGRISHECVYMSCIRCIVYTNICMHVYAVV